MSKRAIKLVKTARKNITKRRRMSYVTPPQSPDNRSDRQKILDLDIQRRETRRARRLAHQNNYNNNIGPIMINLNNIDNVNNLPNQFGEMKIQE